MEQLQHLFFKIKSIILDDLPVISQYLNLSQNPVHWLSILKKEKKKREKKKRKKKEKKKKKKNCKQASFTSSKVLNRWSRRKCAIEQNRP